MSILVSCACGKQFKVKDELAGRRGKCPGCGRSLTVPALAPAADETKSGSARPASCPSCQETLQPNAVLCLQCGHDLRTGKQLQCAKVVEPIAVDPSPATETETGTSPPAWIAITAAGVCLALILSAGWLFFARGSKKSVAARPRDAGAPQEAALAQAASDPAAPSGPLLGAEFPLTNNSTPPAETPVPSTPDPSPPPESAGTIAAGDDASDDDAGGGEAAMRKQLEELLAQRRNRGWGGPRPGSDQAAQQQVFDRATQIQGTEELEGWREAFRSLGENVDGVKVSMLLAQHEPLFRDGLFQQQASARYRRRISQFPKPWMDKWVGAFRKVDPSRNAVNHYGAILSLFVAEVELLFADEQFREGEANQFLARIETIPPESIATWARHQKLEYFEVSTLFMMQVDWLFDSAQFQPSRLNGAMTAWNELLASQSVAGNRAPPRDPATPASAAPAASAAPVASAAFASHGPLRFEVVSLESEEEYRYSYAGEAATTYAESGFAILVVDLAVKNAGPSLATFTSASFQVVDGTDRPVSATFLGFDNLICQSESLAMDDWNSISVDGTTVIRYRGRIHPGDPAQTRIVWELSPAASHTIRLVYVVPAAVSTCRFVVLAPDG